MRDDHVAVDVTHEQDEDGNAAEYELAEAEDEAGEQGVDEPVFPGSDPLRPLSSYSITELVSALEKAVARAHDNGQAIRHDLFERVDQANAAARKRTSPAHPPLTEREQADLAAFRAASSSHWGDGVQRGESFRIEGRPMPLQQPPLVDHLHAARQSIADADTKFNENLERSRKFAIEQARKVMDEKNARVAAARKRTAQRENLDLISKQAWGIHTALGTAEYEPSLDELQVQVAKLASNISDLADHLKENL
jgi:hypothetical protein